MYVWRGTYFVTLKRPNKVLDKMSVSLEYRLPKNLSTQVQILWAFSIELLKITTFILMKDSTKLKSHKFFP